jgi:hypothetical protein
MRPDRRTDDHLHRVCSPLALPFVADQLPPLLAKALR